MDSGTRNCGGRRIFLRDTEAEVTLSRQEIMILIAAAAVIILILIPKLDREVLDD